MRKLMIIMILGIMLISGCTTSNEMESDSCNVAGTCNAVLDTPETEEVKVDKLEVYHFHGNQQCTSCKTVGAYAEETVNTYFQEEVESGKIVFDHINGDLAENRELVQKYGATGSSLWLGTYQDGKFEAEQNTKVWYKIRDKQDYMDYLKGVIEAKLAGE